MHDTDSRPVLSLAGRSSAKIKSWSDVRREMRRVTAIVEEISNPELTRVDPNAASKKGGKKGKYSKGRGKGKGGKGQFDSRNPNRLPPPDWDRSKGAWKCTCGQFNQHWKNWCSFCSTPKPQ